MSEDLLIRKSGRWAALRRISTSATAASRNQATPTPPFARSTVVDRSPSPGLVEAHTHLDKTLVGMDWFENRVGPTRNDRILADRKAKRELGIDALRQSARQVLQTLAFGVTHIRSHVDADTEIGIANVEGVIGTREAFR
ncbi:hypothetical protein [Mesorhizobium sp. B2-3-11]|uniref:hypothetical protein n=1 Tax=Mesorhizobium sp. B2-3-11 TaxID=2589953 RepID=UPI001FEE6939|nr:hypothetical protein [Mesorhizobium sp. B2-3-11]